MTINLKGPELRELKPRITVCGVGGGGCNAVNNMIASGLSGVEFIVANTDAQALTASRAERIIQMGLQVTEGLGAGAQPEVGRAAAEEAIEEIRDHLQGAHMCFVTAGMGGGTGTGAAPVIARAARDLGILTVGVVTKPFQFEGQRRMRTADAGIGELMKHVDTLIVIPNQNLFRIATERTTFADAFAMADQVLYSGVASITDLMVKQGLVNLDFADVRSIMREMGKAMMGTGEASGDQRAIHAAEAAIANPLLDEVSMKGARGLLISITGGADMTLYEVDEAASRIRQEVDEDANIILGATFDESLAGVIRVSVVATGIDKPAQAQFDDAEAKIAEAAERLRAQAAARQQQVAAPAPAPAPVLRAPEPAPAPVYAQPAPAPEPAPVAYAPQPTHTTHPQDLVHLAEMPQQPAYYPPPQQHAQPAPEPQQPRTAFVPPPAEQPMRARQMPQIDDLPLPVAEQLRAYRAGEPAPAANGVEQRRQTLLQRLASFANSREDSAKAPREPQMSAPRQVPVAQPQGRPAQQAPAHAEYAKRPAQQRPAGAYDNHGRAVAARPAEEEQLEIPAFLRRQSM
jgi:cell division protein FtsZ